MSNNQVMDGESSSSSSVDFVADSKGVAKEDLLPRKAHLSGAKRRSEADLRNENLAAGALLLFFESVLPAPPQDATVAWRTIERKGLRVTRTGCLIPHHLHTPDAHHRTAAVAAAMRFFTGRSPDSARAGSKNHLGWPEHEEHSHLCHRFSCCNPSHLVIEPFWKNRKRNFCGLNGKCDCGMQPACIRPYENRDATDLHVGNKANLLLYEEHGLAEKLRQHVPLARSVRLLPGNHYHAEDVKRLNRIKRLRRGDVHKQQGKKKEKKTPQ